MQTGIFILDYLFRDPLTAVFFLIAIIVAVTVHEFAHAFVASRQGDQTARYLGRVTLNPASHLDPAGSFLFLLAGIGWGRPVPVNPYNLKEGKLGDFYVSIAGIVTNLFTAFIFTLPIQILAAVGSDITPSALSENPGLLFARVMVEVNILLAAFNLIPIPPLDGSKAIGIFIPRRFEPVYQEYLRVGPVLLIGIFLLALTLKLNVLGFIIDPIKAVFSFITFLPTSLR